MLSENSDDDFSETNFCEPSPIKKSTLLPPAKERNEQQLKREQLRNQIFKTEKECFSVIGNSLKVKEDEQEADKRVLEYSEVSLFSPRGRTFFEPQKILKDSLVPFLWLDHSSPFYEMTLEEFIFNIPQYDLANEEERERNKLILFCLDILVIETDPVVINLLVNLLSKQIIDYDIIALKDWGGHSLPFLVHLISKSVSGYTAAQTRELFRQACLAALDAKTFSLTSELTTLISECLIVFGVQQEILKEVDWLISLDLKPEEGFRILEVLPVHGLYGNLNLCFAFKFLPSILGLKCSHLEDQVVSWRNLVKFLEENETKIQNLTPNFYFIFMYVLEFIMSRIAEDDHQSVEMMLNVVDGFKLHFCHERRKKGNMSHYLSMAAINRLHLICYELFKSKKV